MRLLYAKIDVGDILGHLYHFIMVHTDTDYAIIHQLYSDFTNFGVKTYQIIENMLYFHNFISRMHEFCNVVTKIRSYLAWTDLIPLTLI